MTANKKTDALEEMHKDKIIIIDNYDSFTYNLVHLIEDITDRPIEVVKNDQLELEDLESYAYIVLSPGPGLPSEAGLLKEIIEHYSDTKKILGVCLGLQAIAEVFGGKLKNLDTVYHGIKEEITINEEDSILFNGLGKSIEIGRYHSWVIDKSHPPSAFHITAVDKKGEIMAIEHESKQVYAVQFHPESIMTPMGKVMMENFLSIP